MNRNAQSESSILYSFQFGSKINEPIRRTVAVGTTNSFFFLPQIKILGAYIKYSVVDLWGKTHYTTQYQNGQIKHIYWEIPKGDSTAT